MTTYQFEDNSAIFSGCNTDNDGTRTYIKNAVTAGAYVENTINISTEGWYDISINYTQGLSSAGESVSPWKILVNGANEYRIDLPSTGAWNQWTTNHITKIYLNSGNNTLRFIQFGAPADLDFYILDFSVIQVIEMPEKMVYQDENGDLKVTSPARQNIRLNDVDFTEDNFDLTIGSSSNRFLIFDSITGTKTVTLRDANWENLEPSAEIEFYRRSTGTVQFLTDSGILIENTSNFNLEANGFAILKHIKDKIWMLKGDLSA